MTSLALLSSAAVVLAAYVTAVPRIEAARPFIGSTRHYTPSPSKGGQDRLPLSSMMPVNSMKPMESMKPTNTMDSIGPKRPEKPMPPRESPFDGDMVIEPSASPEAIPDPFQPPIIPGDNGLEPSETPDMEPFEFTTPPKVVN